MFATIFIIFCGKSTAEWDSFEGTTFVGGTVNTPGCNSGISLTSALWSANRNIVAINCPTVPYPFVSDLYLLSWLNL